MNEEDLKEILKQLYRANWVDLGQYVELNDYDNTEAFNDWYNTVVVPIVKFQLKFGNTNKTNSTANNNKTND